MEDAVGVVKCLLPVYLGQLFPTCTPSSFDLQMNLETNLEVIHPISTCPSSFDLGLLALPPKLGEFP